MPRTWADYINVGMEHGAFDMAGLAEYMRGLVDGGPTRSGHRTPTVIVEAPVNGTDEANVRYNAWQFRQILGRGVHGILLCQAETADAVRAFVEVLPLPAPRGRRRSRRCPSPLERMRGATAATAARRSRRRSASARAAAARKPTAAPSGASPTEEYLRALRPLAAQPARRAAARRQAREPGGRRQLRRDPGRAGPRLCRDGPRRPRPVARLPHHAARALPARDAGGARPHLRRLPQERRRVPGGLHASRTSRAKIDEGVRVVAGHREAAARRGRQHQGRVMKV